ncbi:MBL fold metallo-hydrolase [Candidatus Shapirobacteria bacterium]|jgi:competence protein ComEC|nr:MBL fold metallo-hydrolase [Candidatus Shapirobacteria bacterium]
MKNKIIFLFGLAAGLVVFYLTLPESRGKVVFCDVGQGDAILASYKNIQILVDTGPDNKKLGECLARQIPFWDKTIETVILTHGDSDHIGGLRDLMKAYKVEKFFSNGLLSDDIEQKIYSQKLRQNDIISNNLFEFEVVSPGQNNIYEVDDNINSLAGVLRYKPTGWSVLLTGDIDIETEQRLVWRQILDQKIEVLKVSHHGSENGTSEELLEAIKPTTAVISVGGGNRFGHPREEVLERLSKRNIDIKRTDKEGDIIFMMER